MINPTLTSTTLNLFGKLRFGIFPESMFYHARVSIPRHFRGTVPQIQRADGGRNDPRRILSESFSRCALTACAKEEGRKYTYCTHTMASTVQKEFWRYAATDVDHARAMKMQSHRPRTSPMTIYVIISFRPCARTVRTEKTPC